MSKKYLFLGLLIVSFLVAPLFLRAETMMTDDIARQIASLRQQIAELQRQLAQLQGQAGRQCFMFNRNLGVGASGRDVRELHAVLTKEGFPVNSASLISSASQIVSSHSDSDDGDDDDRNNDKKIENESNRTDRYTEATAAAVSAFQLKYKDEILTPLGLSNPTGYVGPATRRVLNRLDECKKVVLSPLFQQLQVISPNGGEVWAKSVTQRIIWSPPFGVGKVSISLIGYSANYDCISRGGTVCPQDISSVTSIAEDVPNTGSFNWTTIGRIGVGRYWLSICAVTSNQRLCDRSDSIFTIISESQSGNQPPTVSGVSGPTTLNVGQTATWTVQASDPENGTLNYSVIWGDEPMMASGSMMSPSSVPIQQIATFTHSYARAGTYYPKFKVTDNSGQSNSASLSVRVGSDIAELKITPESLPTIVKGQYYNQIPFYSQVLKANGFSSGNLTWSIISGALPNGFSLNRQHIVCISTTPCPDTETYSAFIYGNTENVTLGTYTFTVQATNGIQTARRQYTLNVVSDQSASSVQVLSPNGGEQWVANSVKPITWRYDGATSATKVDLYLDNVCGSIPTCAIWPGGPIMLDKNIAALSTYNWIVATDIVNNPIRPSTYKVRICEAGAQTNCDSSDNYFTVLASSSGNLPPVISGVSGPTTLNLNQTGTWTITARDPENGELWYYVDWGDRVLVDYGGIGANGIPSDFRQITTFTHAYSAAGNYAVKFLVRDTAGHQAESSVTISVQ